ncbi:DMT family transporter [Ktedonobacter robiniae]|nr:DMT family transporter [Ktedonobacter robiniae]
MPSSTTQSVPTAADPHKARMLTLLGFGAMVLVWGSFPVAAKIGTEHVPPLLFSAVRFLLAFLLLLLVARWRRESLWITRTQHLRIFLTSLFMVGIPAAIFFASIPYAPAGALTLMWATAPLFVSLFNFRGAGEARGWRLPVSLLIGIAGILLVLLGRVPFLPNQGASIPGFAMSGPALIAELVVLVSAAVYGFGMLLAKRYSADVPVLVMTAWQVFYSGVVILLASLIFEHGGPFAPTWSTLEALLYLVVFCSCISFFLTFWLIRRIGAIRTAYSDFIIPGVTLLLSYWLLGEELSPAKLGGFLLVMLGCALVEK